MTPGPSTHLRIARPSGDLARAERFWVDGLGLDVLWRSYRLVLSTRSWS